MSRRDAVVEQQPDVARKPRSIERTPASFQRHAGDWARARGVAHDVFPPG
jgi:hypothetical protein